MYLARGLLRRFIIKNIKTEPFKLCFYICEVGLCAAKTTKVAKIERRAKGRLFIYYFAFDSIIGTI